MAKLSEQFCRKGWTELDLTNAAYKYKSLMNREATQEMSDRIEVLMSRLESATGLWRQGAVEMLRRCVVACDRIVDEYGILPGSRGEP